MSVYLPQDFVPPSNSLHPSSGIAWGTFQQLHGSNLYSAPPVFAIGATDKYYVQLWSGDLDYYWRTNPEKMHHSYYNIGDLQRGKWVDFVWKIKYAKTFTGSLDVWKRVEGETGFTQVIQVTNIPTVQFKSTVQNGAILDAYWKTGYYTSQEIFTRTLYVDSHTRGDNFNEVVSAAFGATPTSVATPIQLFNVADLEPDGDVDISDYAILVSNFGRMGASGFIRSDILQNGVVDIYDFNKLITNFGL
jgi:hypothetical protein